MKARLRRLRNSLLEKRFDGLLISSAYNIAYLTGFFGFSKIEREGYLLVTQTYLYFFASGLNSEAVSEHINNGLRPQDDIRVELVVISPRSPLTKKALARILRKEKIKKLGFEKNNLTFAEVEELVRVTRAGGPQSGGPVLVSTVGNRWGWRAAGPALIPTENLVENLRAVKDPEEIEAIRKACKLGDKVFDYILGKIKPGITEKKLAFEIELFIRKTGADISFPPIVAFGANSSIPHHQSTHNSKLITNNIVLMDFGVKIDNYCSDMTRTVFFGEANKEQRRMYQIVFDAQQKAIEYLRLLTSDGGRLSLRSHDSSEVDAVARDYIVKQGYPTIPHSLGHGIGLEVHELPRLSPRSNDKLAPGMVFSVEPGIYLSRRSSSEGGLVGGVRIEDLVVLEPSGPRLLTESQRNLIEI